MSQDLNTFKEKYPFIIQDKVQWGDMDAFAHVNNTVYFRYFERVRFSFFDEYGLMDEKETTGVGPVLASTRCRYKVALEYPDTIFLGTSITGLEHDRFLMHYAIFSEELNTVAAEGDGFIIYYNYLDKVKSQIPESQFQRLSALAG